MPNPSLPSEDSAYRVVETGRAPLLLTCEHASEHLPSPWGWHPEDDWLRGTHWASDLGAAAVTEGLAHTLGCTAVLAGFTRLLIDPNRALDGPNLFREEAEGRSIRLNQSLSPTEKQRRIEGFYQPYYQALHTHAACLPRAPLLSIHTFTPVYEGTPRSLELGVLFDREPDLARAAQHQLTTRGWDTALNEPYSGYDGLIHGVKQPATALGRAYLEIEINQALATDSSRQSNLISDLAATLHSIWDIQN